MTNAAEACPLCGAAREQYAVMRVLGRYQAQFDRCRGCGFIGARQAHWLDEAYSEAITKLDLGLLWRCNFMANVIETIGRAEGLSDATFLDWAGGYGVLTRMMRDRGLEYYHHDPLCVNLFAGDFEGDPGRPYALVSAIEVLEHLADPVAELTWSSGSTDRLLLTTELIPTPLPTLQDWWYSAPETGQHISFFTADALHHLAARLGYRAYVGASSVHLLARVPISNRTRLVLRRPLWARPILKTMRKRRGSLLQMDYEAALATLRSSSR